MMDWAKQSEDMMNSWMQMQKQMWDSFFTNISELGKTPTQRLWEETIKVGEQAIQSTFDIQRKWMQMWSDFLASTEGVPEYIVGSYKSFAEMSDKMIHNQEQIWKNWIETLKRFDTSKVSANWAGTSPNPYQAWQDNTQKLMDAQAEWLRSWSQAIGKMTDDYRSAE